MADCPRAAIASGCNGLGLRLPRVAICHRWLKVLSMTDPIAPSPLTSCRPSVPSRPQARVAHLVAMYVAQGAHNGAQPAAAQPAAHAGSAEAEPPPTTISAISNQTAGKLAISAISDQTAGELAAAVESLRKRRGGAATAAALEALRRGEYSQVADQALEYYDGLYDEYARSSRRRHVLEVTCEAAGEAVDAVRVLAAVQEGGWRGDEGAEVV